MNARRILFGACTILVAGGCSSSAGRSAFDGSAGVGGSGGGAGLGGVGGVGGVGGLGGSAGASDAGVPKDAEAGPDAVNNHPCVGPQPWIVGSDTGFEVCASGAVHRSGIRACPARVPAPCSAQNPAVGGGAMCATDSDCMGAPGGECLYRGPIPSQPGFPGDPNDSCACFYGGCFSDADCGAGRICLCSDNQPGSCIAASCRSDADCRPGFLCTSSSFRDLCTGRTPFTCQAPADLCGGDDDCTTGYSQCTEVQDAGSQAARQCVPINCSA